MTLPRSLDTELLDEDGHDPVELAESLNQVAQVNRWLGGERSLRRHLRPLLERSNPVRILDVGTGNGQTLAELLAWARRRSRPWTGVGVDRSAEMVRLSGTAVATVQADGQRLPFRDEAFDAVLCTLTLHHFDDNGATRLLREMARVSRGMVLVSDLERSRAHYLGARLLAATVWRGNRLTRTDGPHSVLRAFTRAELLALAERAGLQDARVQRFMPWRLLLAVRV